MKRLLLFVSVLLCATLGRSEPLPADHILAFVRTKLPNDPLKLTGTLKVKTRNGFTKSSLPVEMALNWGAATPSAIYKIGKESLTITWKNDIPSYRFSSDGNKPTDEILGTGVTWADLSFSVLWWPGPRLIDEAKKINWDCYVVEVPVPDSDKIMHLWIGKETGMLLESQTFDAKKKQLSRMKIKSVKKMDGLWVAKDLEIKDYTTGNKTTLQITDLEWERPAVAPDGPTGPTAAAFDPAESINRFAFDLYNELSKQEGNLCFSPYSISSALAMTYGGARGKTETEMKNTLHFGVQGATHPALSHLRKKLNGIQKKGHVQLSIANSLWPEKSYPLLKNYLSLTREHYGVEIESVDFKNDTEGARRKINQWTEKQTNDQIKNLIPEGGLNELTRLVLANAIYFKGDWAEKFSKSATRKSAFHLRTGKKVMVPMMSLSSSFKYARSEQFQALELPYEGGDLSMIVLLPGKPGPFPDIGADTLSTLVFREIEVDVKLPRFKNESSFGLNNALMALGMPLAFDTNKADFSGMNGSGKLYIGSTFHKAFVEVNEEGTEAAAATGVVMELYCATTPFIADRPFLFLIRENSTGIILFMGRVMDPSK